MGVVSALLLPALKSWIRLRQGSLDAAPLPPPHPQPRLRPDLQVLQLSSVVLQLPAPVLNLCLPPPLLLQTPHTVRAGWGRGDPIATRTSPTRVPLVL